MIAFVVIDEVLRALARDIVSDTKRVLLRYRERGRLWLIRKLALGGTIMHNATIDHGTLMLSRSNSIVSNSNFLNAPIALKVKA